MFNDFGKNKIQNKKNFVFAKIWHRKVILQIQKTVKMEKSTCNRHNNSSATKMSNLPHLQLTQQQRCHNNCPTYNNCS
jgi:hypothetical protein